MHLTNLEKENFFLGQDFLSDVELYFSQEIDLTNSLITISGDEAKHIIRVMRHKVEDSIFVTDGEGVIYSTCIENFVNNLVICKIEEKKVYNNFFENIFICIPIIKNFDRLEFALEKCVELGITNFLIYQASRSKKKNPKLERWQKITTAAMKQSLRSYLPTLQFIDRLEKLPSEKVILFDQNGDIRLQDWVSQNISSLNSKRYFLFGPEGGLSSEEISLFPNSSKLHIAKNRLRSETAIITLATHLNSVLE